ncbi:hypothetical protein V6N13_002310 [Hibiscus sabdariffa]|uniref:Uncharacterized protein n=1 Tax=Hibiscus sabdariffa TaxID=183260 RepID=A0ABR2C2G4_9ROSI
MVVIIMVARHNDPSTSTQKQVGRDESGSNSIKTHIGGAPNLNHEKDQLGQRTNLCTDKSNYVWKENRAVSLCSNRDKSASLWWLFVLLALIDLQNQTRHIFFLVITRTPYKSALHF